VIPTDTVYGIATRPDEPEATARLFAAKGRPVDLALPVLVATTGEARRLAAFDTRAERLAAELWPGAVTLVLPRSPASANWSLGGSGASIGVRVPRHDVAIAVLADGGPLAVTSANRTGEPPARTCEELERTFGDLVEVYLCQETTLEGSPSSVVDLTGPTARVLRQGTIDPVVLQRLLA
jgi:tRNA threonylcarbamoyl adenosine modification protein (Sua5/YciO/YrdC/YwlC family)